MSELLRNSKYKLERHSSGFFIFILGVYEKQPPKMHHIKVYEHKVYLFTRIVHKFWTIF